MQSETQRQTWLERHRAQRCPQCQPQTFPYSLIRAVYWCPTCKRVWRFMYLNKEAAISQALRWWWFEGDQKTRHRV